MFTETEAAILRGRVMEVIQRETIRLRAIDGGTRRQRAGGKRRRRRLRKIEARIAGAIGLLVRIDEQTMR